MLSHHKFVAIIGCLILCIVVAASVLYWRNHRCIQADQKYCEFLATLSDKTFEHTHGMFTTQKGVKETYVTWMMNGQNKQIRVLTNNTETMNMIATQDQVYVKDYRDGLWWNQTKADMKQYIVELEFDPEIFLGSVVERLKNPKTQIQRLKEVSCGAEQCVRYQVTNNRQANAEYIDINRGSNQLARYVGQYGEDTIAFDVQYEAMDITIPIMIKPAAKGQNIFLEQYLYNPVGQSASDLEYVQKFEREMKENSE